MKNIVETFGWYGTATIIGAYILVSFSAVSFDSFWYQILNLTGALGIMTISFSKKAYQPAILNIIWAVIAIIALIKLLF